MDFSRKMLESNLVVIYDPAICITTQYRPSERTEYGLGTEVQKVNSNTEFQVYHPLVYL